ncbi:NAD(P)-dependent dehydrogenase (short-subunit alcohol dehydrogenase family) [Saonia flava]|uniref:NAD(P)-dependent dehydrogenase (Short-subunit alcohol dehydrogenase family) n=1 Tax=Saonia flava TaxID=523696 RepID=A0A846QZE8_9FLAO|nr:short chain dehydrogenase [Saonia flava]NJB69969.1 NAD(P)-dependent dehydrogenase (short-subunit alcohol dehydrogenase family) [Saonia flava]
MKIVIVGGNGTIGKKVSSYLSKKHKVIIAGRKKGDAQVDITNSDSITSMFQSIGQVDAIISIAGEAKWAPFNELSEEDFYIGLQSKLMGQVNLVRIGKEFLNSSGSITLTTGILADDPVKMTTSAAMVNGAIHSFVKAVKLEMNNGIRVNVVSPGLVEDAVKKYHDYFPGHIAIPMDKVVNGYVRSLEGTDNGEVIRIY